ncbi:MAG: SDR family oxidoreductase [Chloroflexota bacterium]|nr:SDR family oxidoreductase [Chloroflexota bacterium]
MNNELSLTGKTALVTGAGGGIGSAIVERLIKAGASVALHYHTSEERVLQLQKLYGDNICYLTRADFADTQSVQEVLDDVWSWKQKIDILINNAALIESVESIDNISEQDLIKAMQVNFIAPFLLAKKVLQKMNHEGYGRITSISSIAVKYAGSPQMAHYMASKAALEAGMLALAKHAATSGVLVNVVRAGVTKTDAHQRIGRDDLSARESLIPIGRAADPSEIAEVVAFLVSPLNTYMTGAIVPVAGGE